MTDIQHDNKMRVELIKSNASDIDVARAAWVSNYGEDAREKDADRIEGLINFLYREKHMSPFEHGSFTFFLDVPIFVAREFMRHRTFSFNEVSGRYTTLKPKFYVPANHRPLIQQGKVGNYTFVPGTDDQVAVGQRMDQVAYKNAWNSYEAKMTCGIAREVARNVLPVGIYTQFYATCNPRNLMQFLTLRNASNALYEIRDVAEQMEELFELQMPLTWKAFAKVRDDAAVDWKSSYGAIEQELELQYTKYDALLIQYRDMQKALRELQEDYNDLSRTINEGGE